MIGHIFSVKRFAVHDGDGIRTTVFFKGCPLSCRWCHNPEGISPKPVVAYYQNKCKGCGACLSACPRGALQWADGVLQMDRTKCIACGACATACVFDAREAFGRRVEVDALVEELVADLPFFESSGGGVTLSGGECLAQGPFALALMEALCKKGISVAVDTCGLVSRDVLERSIPFASVYLYDLKAIDPAVHRSCTGQDNELILSNLTLLSQRGCRIQIRIPFVKGCNDAEIERMGAFLQGLKGIEKVTVLRYHDMARSKYRALDMEDTMPENRTERADVEAAVEKLRSFGLPAIPGWDD